MNAVELFLHRPESARVFGGQFDRFKEERLTDLKAVSRSAKVKDSKFPSHLFGVVFDHQAIDDESGQYENVLLDGTMGAFPYSLDRIHYIAPRTANLTFAINSEGRNTELVTARFDSEGIIRAENVSPKQSLYGFIAIPDYPLS